MEPGSLDLARLGAGIKAPTAPKGDTRAIEKSAREFEGVFISQMFEQMWSSVPTDGTFGGGNGEKVFRSMMIQEMGKQLANQGGVGLADAVKREMIAMQERGRP